MMDDLEEKVRQQEGSEEATKAPTKRPDFSAVLDAFYFHSYEYFSVKGAALFHVENKEGDGNSYMSQSGEASSSTLTSPVLFAAMLALRTLNRSWLSRFSVFAHIANDAKNLVSYDLSFIGPNPFASRSFTADLKYKGPPSRHDAATSCADSHYSGFLDGADLWDKVKGRVTSRILQTGTCDLEQEFGLTDGPTGTLHYEEMQPPATPPTEPSPAARLAGTELGARLLATVEQLRHSNQVWESDTEAAWPQKNHDHLVRCVKFLVLAAHDQPYERAVSISDEGGYGFEGVSSSKRSAKVYIERTAPSGKHYWLSFAFSSRFTVEM